MTKVYIRLKAPVEFKNWLTTRQNKMTGIARNLGLMKHNKNIPLTKIMRMIAKTDGVTIYDDTIKQYVKKK